MAEDDVLRDLDQYLKDRGPSDSLKPPPLPRPAQGTVVTPDPQAGLSPRALEVAEQIRNGTFQRGNPIGTAEGYDQTYGLSAVEGEPGFLERTTDFGKSLIYSAFDYEDTTANLRERGVVRGLFAQKPYETIWDLSLYPLMKLYERTNQAGSYLGALAPGGIDPISFTDAGTIAPGQIATLNTAVSLRNIQERRPNYGLDIANVILTGMTGTSPLIYGSDQMKWYRDINPFIGDYGTEEEDPMLPTWFMDNPEQFLDPARKEEVFSQGKAKMASGTYDFMWALVVDPLAIIPFGKGLKFTRLKYIDMNLAGTNSGPDLERLASELATAGDDTTKRALEFRQRTGQSPTAADLGYVPPRETKFGSVYRALKEDPKEATAPLVADLNYVMYGTDNQAKAYVKKNGNDRIHYMMRAIVDPENALTRHFTAAQRHNAALLLYRSQMLSDYAARQAFQDAFPGLSTFYRNWEGASLEAAMMPDNADIKVALQNQAESYPAMASVAQKTMNNVSSGSPEWVAASDELKSLIYSMSEILANGKPLENLAQAATLNKNPLTKTILKEAKDADLAGQNEMLLRAAQAADELDLLNEIGKTNAGFLTGKISKENRLGRNTRLGRANQERRRQNLTKQASIQPLVGDSPFALVADMAKGVFTGAPAESTVFKLFSVDGSKKYLRVWRLPGEERPSGRVQLDGLGDVDNVREISAAIFSTRAFTGPARIDPATGKAWGGKEQGEKLLDEWTKATYGSTKPDVARKALVDLERKLLKHIYHYQSLKTRFNQAEGSAVVLNKSLKKLKDTNSTETQDLKQMIYSQVEGAAEAKVYGRPEITDQIMDLMLDFAIDASNKGKNSTMMKLKQGNSYWFQGDELNHIPVLSSQFANTYQLYNFRAFETDLLNTNWTRQSFLALSGVLNLFSMLWRPAVLFRLGYTQRNIGEGEFRSLMYNQSFEPVASLFYKAGAGVADLIQGNAGRASGQRQLNKAARRTQKIMDRADKAREASRQGKSRSANLLRRDPSMQKEIDKELNTLRNQLAQADYTLAEGLENLIKYAVEFGLEDATDFLREIADDIKNMAPEVPGPPKVKPRLEVPKEAQPFTDTAARRKSGEGPIEGRGPVKEVRVTSTGQVQLTIPAAGAGKPKIEIITLNPGKLLSPNGSVFTFKPGKNFTIKSIDEKNNMMKVTAGGKTFDVAVAILRGRQSGPNYVRQVLDDAVRQSDEQYAMRVAKAETQKIGQRITGGGFNKPMSTKKQATTIPKELADELGIRSDYTDAKRKLAESGEYIERYRPKKKITYDKNGEEIFDEVDTAVMQGLYDRLRAIEGASGNIRYLLDQYRLFSDDAAAIQVIAQRRATKYAERRKRMIQDAGTTIVPGLLQRAQNAAPFDPRNPLSEPAASAVSAATTTRYRLVNKGDTRMQGFRDVQRVMDQEVPVPKFGDPRTKARFQNGRRKQQKPDRAWQDYNEGVASNLTQLGNDFFGKAVIEAETVVKNGVEYFTPAALEDLMRLFKTPEGRKKYEAVVYQDFGDTAGRTLKNPEFKQAGINGSDIRRGSLEDLQNQQDYLLYVLRYFERLTPWGELRNGIRAGNIPIAKGSQKLLRQVENQSYEYTQGRLSQPLKPVTGPLTITSSGTRGLYEKTRDVYKNFVDNSFNWIGTIPEDALTRGPFYTMEYERVYSAAVTAAEELLKKQTGRKFLNGDELGRIMYESHKTATRATRKYLYTIERRTWLGDNFETVIPFVSASQNVAQAVGRMSMNDPTIPLGLAYYWARPMQTDAVNDKGEFEMAFLEPLIPQSWRDAGWVELTGDFGSANVLFPDTGFGPFSRPGPIVTLPASAVMSSGLFASQVAPERLTRALGQDTGDKAWSTLIKWTFGDMGPMPGPAYQSLPAWMQKLYVRLVSNEDSAQYTKMMNDLVMTDIYALSLGEYDPDQLADQALMKQIWDDALTKTNWMYGLILPLMNVTLPTSVRIDPALKEVIEEYRFYQKTYGDDANRLFLQQYGELALMGAKTSATANTGGVDIETISVQRAKQFDELNREIANMGLFANDPDLIGIILNDPDPNAEYDFNIGALRWLQTNEIPGTNTYYRELLSPQEAANAASASAGWTYWLEALDELNAIAYTRGLDSYERADDLVYASKLLKQEMQKNPLFAGWSRAYGLRESNVTNVISMMDIMVGDTPGAVKFRNYSETNYLLFTGMVEYLDYRAKIREYVAQVPYGITAEANRNIQNGWLDFVDDLNIRNPVFGEFYSRYLFSDRERAANDLMEAPPAMLGYQQEVPVVPEPQLQGAR